MPTDHPQRRTATRARRTSPTAPTDPTAEDGSTKSDSAARASSDRAERGQASSKQAAGKEARRKHTGAKDAGAKDAGSAHTGTGQAAPQGASLGSSGTPGPLPEDRVAQIRAQWAVEWPELDTSPMAVIARIHRLAQDLNEELDTVYRRFGLGAGDFDVLATLRREGPPYELPAGSLASYTMVTTGAISKRLDRLESAGLVSRRRSAADGRGRMVTLTPAGHELMDRAMAAHMANEKRLLADIPASDAAQLAHILHAWLLHYEG